MAADDDNDDDDDSDDDDGDDDERVGVTVTQVGSSGRATYAQRLDEIYGRYGRDGEGTVSQGDHRIGPTNADTDSEMGPITNTPRLPVYSIELRTGKFTCAISP
jgi:hypothetical protein